MYKRQKHIEVETRPLRLSGAIEVMGSVPAKQVYQASTGEYVPDYTLTPLTLFPRCNATNPDAEMTDGGVNANLTNMRWYEVADGTRTLIESTNTGYSITQSGEEKGKLQLKKNVSTLSPLTLEFQAEYVDPSGQRYTFRYSFLVRAVDGSEAQPALMIDSPAGLDWNPLRDTARQTIAARLLVADEDVTETDACRLFFYRLLPDTGALELITDGNGDSDWEVVSVTKSALTIDRNYIGHEQGYVVKASYDAGGNPPEEPDDSIPQVSTVIRRRIPALECDFSGVPLQVPADTKELRPEAIVRDTRGVLDDPWDVLRADWYKKVGTGNYTLAAQGAKPTIPFTSGMMLQLEIADRGPLALLTSDEGTFLADSAGRVIVARKPVQ